MSKQEKQQNQAVASEPEVAYGNKIDSLKSTVIDAVQHIQDANFLERILSFITKTQQEDIPNEETLAAMREAESSEGLEVVDTSSVEAMVASILR